MVGAVPVSAPGQDAELDHQDAGGVDGACEGVTRPVHAQILPTKQYTVQYSTVHPQLRATEQSHLELEM